MENHSTLLLIKQHRIKPLFHKTIVMTAKTIKLLLILLLGGCLSAHSQTRIRSMVAGGNWGTATTWVGGVIPTGIDTAEIIAGSTVTMATATGNMAGSIEISGTLSFAATGVSCTVNGNMVINAGGAFNPYFSSTGKPVTVYGNFINNGTTDLSKNSCMLTMAQAGSNTVIGGTGTYTTGVIRSLTIDNSNSVTLSVPLSVSYTLALQNGTFTNGTQLTLNDKSFGNGTTPPYCIIQRSQSAQLSANYTLHANAALYVIYTQNPAGANPGQTMAEGYEIPTGRAFHNLTINNPNGVNINDDITLKSALAAITLTSGIIKMAAGKTLICNNSSNAGTAGSATSYVDGAVALAINTTEGTRTFPVGSEGKNRKVTITGLKAALGSGTLIVRFVIENSGGGTAGLGISLPNSRRYKGTILSGTLGSFKTIAIDANTDDGVGANGVVAYSISNNRSYYSLGNGITAGTTITSPEGPYNIIRYYALASAVAPTPDNPTSPMVFITRSGDRLMEGPKEFRFVGMNTYTLTGMAVGGWHMPDEYEVRDIFKTVRQMGGTAARTIMFSIIGGEANGNGPSHITAQRTYNDTLFRYFDKVLQLAHEYKVRLIIPLIGYADSRGGINQFAAFRSMTGLQFFTDTGLIADYKHFVHYVVNRTNFYTGIKYKDDPAILCWETGSEFRDSTSTTSVDNWTMAVAPYFKSVDPNHLLMDGKESTVICKPHCLTPVQMNNPATDIITEHYYETKHGTYATLCNQARDSCAGRKVFVVGEFSHRDTVLHRGLLQAVVSNGTSGALMWSLTHHNKEGGFYFKGDAANEWTPEYRWPGFASANTKEAEKMDQIRRYTYQIRNVIKPAKPVPDAPYLLPASSRNRIIWQGSAGAGSYQLERTPDTTGAWTVVNNQAMDDAIPYVPYNDATATGSGPWYYRIKAQNGSGISIASNIVGPMPAAGRIRSTIAGGGWSFSTTWQGGIIPGEKDTVEVIAGSTVNVNGSYTTGPVEIAGTLAFNINGVSLAVNGDLLVQAGGIFNPYYSSAGKQVTIYGSLINNGTTDLSKNSTVLTMAQSGSGASITGTGTYTTGVARTLVINNSNNVTLAVPLSVSFTLTLHNGTLNNGSNLTMDNTVTGNGGAVNNCLIQRSQSGLLANAYTLGSTAALYIAYIQNAGGANPDQTITEGYEIPSGRSFHNLTINNPNGLLINDDVTLKSNTSAITLTSGVIKLAAGKTLICTSASNTGTAGTATSYVNGGIALTAGTAAVTRTFPVGCQGQNRKVVLSGLKAASGTTTVRFGIDSTGGGTAGTGIVFANNRRWTGNITSGTLGEFTGIAIDYKTDDNTDINGMIAHSGTIGGVYNSLGTGTNTASAISSPLGSWSVLGAYALANPSGPALLTTVTGRGNNIRTEEASSANPVRTGVSIYPNPSSGKWVNVKIAGFQHKVVTILMTDAAGRRVYKATISIANNIYAYPLQIPAGVRKGTYVVTVIGGSMKEYGTLVIQ